MTDIRDIQQARAAHNERFEPNHNEVIATVIAVDGSVTVPNAPSLVWVLEYGRQNSPAPALNEGFLVVEGTPVIVEKVPDKPLREQRRIVRLYTSTIGPAAGTGTVTTRFGAGEHASNHQWPAETTPGPDAIKVYQPALMPLRTLYDGVSLSVAVQPLIYQSNATYKVFSGESLDLTAYVPATANRAKRVLIYLDTATGRMAITEGAETVNSAAIPVPFPAIPSGAIPSAFIKLITGQTAVTAMSYTDARPFLSAGNGGGLPVADNTIILYHQADNTRRLRLNLTNLSPESLRTLSIQDVNGTIYVTGGQDVTLEDGGTEADLSATGPGLVQQRTAGAALSVILCNFEAVAVPTVNDDSGDGYDVGSRWFYSSSEYVCLDATVGAAVWVETTGGGSGTDADAIHDNISGEINAITSKGTPVSADVLLIEDSAASYAKKKITVGSLPSGGGSGDSSYSAAYASRPASSNDGDLFLPTDGYTLDRDNGTSWIPWGPLFPLTRPDNSAFSWVNQGGATVTANDGTIYLEDAVADATVSYHIRAKTAPSTPYVATIGFMPLVPFINFGSVHLGWRQSSTGNIATFRLYYNTNLRFTSFKGTATSDVADYINLNIPFHPPLMWVQLEDDGTNRIIRYGWDGKAFINFHSVSRTDYLTADQLIFAVAPRNTSYRTGVRIIHWKEA